MAEPAVGQVVDGRYEIEAVIGRGGMGSVFRARHVFTNVRVALKVMSNTLDTDAFQRFLAEARAASTIGHPAIVEVSDANRTPDGQLYLAMELLAGKPLRLAMTSTMSGDDVRRVGLELLDALAAAHLRGVIHRDLKPENIFLVAPTGSLKVLDFGIAKMLDAGHTTHGRILGTLEYMAPEQLDDSSQVDARADLWAVGVILYEMVAGVRPFGGATREDKFRALAHDEPVPIAEVVGTTLEVSAFFARALSRDPRARFATAAEMAAELRRLTFSPRSGGHVAPGPTLGSGTGWSQPASNQSGPTLGTGSAWLNPASIAPGGSPSVNPMIPATQVEPGAGDSRTIRDAPREPPRVRGRAVWLGIAGIAVVAGAVTIGVVAGRSASPAQVGVGSPGPLPAPPSPSPSPAPRPDPVEGTPRQPARPPSVHGTRRTLTLEGIPGPRVGSATDPRHDGVIATAARCDRACKRLRACSLAQTDCQRDCQGHVLSLDCLETAGSTCDALASCHWRAICGRAVTSGGASCRDAMKCTSDVAVAQQGSSTMCSMCIDRLTPAAATAWARFNICNANAPVKESREAWEGRCQRFSDACTGRKR